MMATPLAHGLFQAAIGESGGGFGASGHARPRAEAETAGGGFVETLVGPDVQPSLAAMRSASADDVLGVSLPGVGATVDGWVFPDTIYNIFAGGRQHDVPVIIGSNADEGTMFTPPSVTLAGYQEGVRRQYGEFAEEFLATIENYADAGCGYYGAVWSYPPDKMVSRIKWFGREVMPHAS